VQKDDSDGKKRRRKARRLDAIWKLSLPPMQPTIQTWKAAALNLLTWDSIEPRDVGFQENWDSAPAPESKKEARSQ